jgi:rubrerythrin
MPGNAHHQARTGSGQGNSAAIIKDVIGSMTHFYRRAAKKAQVPEVRNMFLSIAEEEQKQFEAIRAYRGRAGAHAAGTIRRMISALKKREDRLLKRIGAHTDEVEALKIAMDIEVESIRLYTKLLREIQTPGQKKIVGSLLIEEQQRYTTFENTCLFLSDPAGWYMWNEQSFADGGTSWA